MKSLTSKIHFYYLLLAFIPLQIHAWCGYIIRNQTNADGSAGGTIEVRIQSGNTEAAELIIVPAGEEKDLTWHDSPICPNPRLIQINGTDGDIKYLAPTYYEPAAFGTFHKMIITVKAIGFNLADKSQRKLIVEVSEQDKAQSKSKTA